MNNMRNDIDMLKYNTAKRLPIVFCLDVSPSMGWPDKNAKPSIELLNAAVRSFVDELKKDRSARASAEIAFVTFSDDIEMNTEFKPISQLEIPTFTAVKEKGTRMANAILKSVEKIEQERSRLENAEIGYYAPFIVLITDGNPDKNDKPEEENLALKVVKEHCNSHIGAQEIIVPFIVGVGDRINPETLNAYAKGFAKGYFPIKANAFKARDFGRVFQLIGNSTKKSIHLNGDSSEILKEIQNDMDDLWSALIGE